MKESANRAVTESIVAVLSPDSSLTGIISKEAVVMAFMSAIDEFITGVIMVMDDKKEAFARLYQIIDAIPAWIETADGKPPDTKDLFGD